MEGSKKISYFRNYRFPVLLLAAIAVGCIVGVMLGPKAEALKPVGTIFLNLIFTVVVPLVLISISSAVANIANLKTLGKILGIMLAIFIITGFLSSSLMISAVKLFPPAEGVQIELPKPEQTEPLKTGDQIVSTFTVPDFSDLLSRKNMLPLIIFSILFGMAVSLAGEKGKTVARGLEALAEVMMKLISILMWIAPIGLGAYFANLVGVFGPELLGSYARAAAVYYPVAIIYFVLFFTLYAFIAGGNKGIRTFWKEILTPAVTALGTGSSVATIPANLAAAQKIGVDREVREIVIPIGATIHMDGSCLSAILKISFLFGIFGMPFTGLDTYLTAFLIALLSGTVMSGVPGGGFIGELLIVTMYGFPPEALPILAILGTLVDPPATMVNATGDTVSSMIVTRWLKGKEWMKQKLAAG
ncbi:dicarboxylate/amino acid:cation symporter [Paenactinomyces guangxiensis]|uniref:Dicarboxylate/amino acid:cation symporter n=1 Tax=Paenactinomyces guangxiensis TaxID=1490290 RepID=A0A7W1WRS4_9BACL|nr:dicarboxylate/amino acid:cation symporter [Paenactinomyces guangxiensis]MBA4494877.1 dicarboxylate/amino acid:cation symporter [Paenactinomyces guangxiensis]MBH8591960.1 dicarboxylate/amino acid:cation symporter [Paenactinomyces guangxiensis]